MTRELVGYGNRDPLTVHRGPGERALLGLQPKHLAFVEAYVRNGRNGTRAVIEVYGCSYGAAKVQAHRLLARESLRRAIAFAGLRSDIVTSVASVDAVNNLTRIALSRKTPIMQSLRASIAVLKVAGALPRRKVR